MDVVGLGPVGEVHRSALLVQRVPRPGPGNRRFPAAAGPAQFIVLHVPTLVGWLSALILGRLPAAGPRPRRRHRARPRRQRVGRAEGIGAERVEVIGGQVERRHALSGYAYLLGVLSASVGVSGDAGTLSDG